MRMSDAKRGLAGDEIGTGGMEQFAGKNWSFFSFSVVAISDSAQVVWSLEQDIGKPRKGRWRAVGLSPVILKVVEAGTKAGAASRRVRECDREGRGCKGFNPDLLYNFDRFAL